MSGGIKKVSREFPGQKEGEKVILVFRRHPITVRKGWLLLFALLALAVALILLFPDQSWTWGAAAVLALFGLIYLGHQLILWYFSVYILTDSRIRQVSQKGLFKKTVVDLRLSSVQSISYEVPGLLGDLYKYGTMMIRTDVGDLRISFVQDPEMVYNELQEAVDKAAKATNAGNSFTVAKKGNEVDG